MDIKMKNKLTVEMGSKEKDLVVSLKKGEFLSLGSLLYHMKIMGMMEGIDPDTDSVAKLIFEKSRESLKEIELTNESTVADAIKLLEEKGEVEFQIPFHGAASIIGFFRMNGLEFLLEMDRKAFGAWNVISDASVEPAKRIVAEIERLEKMEALGEATPTPQLLN